MPVDEEGYEVPMKPPVVTPFYLPLTFTEPEYETVQPQTSSGLAETSVVQSISSQNVSIPVPERRCGNITSTMNLRRSSTSNELSENSSGRPTSRRNNWKPTKENKGT